MEEKSWLRVEDIARELDVADGTVRSWIRNKKLAALRVGKDYRIKREDYEKFIKEHMTDGKEKE
jgi:excisionase family DNA binding protein